jgi:hypothetical protein
LAGVDQGAKALFHQQARRGDSRVVEAVVALESLLLQERQ